MNNKLINYFWEEPETEDSEDSVTDVNDESILLAFEKKEQMKEKNG